MTRSTNRRGGTTPHLARAAWRKSSRSGQDGNCVEVAMIPDAVAVRDSKNPTGPALLFTRAQWAAFIGGVGAGEFELNA